MTNLLFKKRSSRTKIKLSPEKKYGMTQVVTRPVYVKSWSAICKRIVTRAAIRLNLGRYDLFGGAAPLGGNKNRKPEFILL